jgi:hypothetical protein
MLLTACGGGGGGGGDSSSSNSSTNTDTTLGSPSVALHAFSSDPSFTYIPYRYTGTVSNTSASINKSGGPDKLPYTSLPTIYLTGLAADYCPLGTTGGSVIDGDEVLGHYLVECTTFPISNTKALYIIDVNGDLIWQSGSYTRALNQLTKLFNGSVYRDVGTAIQTADYVMGETLHTIHTLTHYSQYQTSRLIPDNVDESITVLSDGTIILKVQEYSASSNVITSSGYYYHVLDAAGKFVTKLSVADLTNWTEQQMGGGDYYIPSVDHAGGIDNYGNFGLPLIDFSKVYPNQFLSLSAADFETLHYMITPPPVVSGGTGGLPSCTTSYDYSLNTGDPQVDLYCQTAWAYACSGTAAGVEGTCQILGQISATYKNQCSYCAGY